MTVEILPEFSIIIPIYNGEHVIERCIKSVLKQDYQAYELILIDDGSSDQTQKICHQLCALDSRIKYYKQVNRGVSSARNHGLRVAANEYILFVDADDYLAPNFLNSFEQLISSHEADGNTFVIQDFVAEIQFAHGNKESFKWCKFPYGKYTVAETFQKLISMNWLSWGVPFAKLYQLSILKRHNIWFNENVSFREDLMFMLDYMNHADTIIFDPTANYHYTIDNTKASLSSTTASFDNEVTFFNYTKQISDSYINKLALEVEVKKVLYNTIYTSFFRCINSCMYNYKIPMPKSQRISKLRALSTKENIQNLLWSGVIDTKMKQIAYFLLKNKLYHLYDVLNKTRFNNAS